MMSSALVAFEFFEPKPLKSRVGPKSLRMESWRYGLGDAEDFEPQGQLLRREPRTVRCPTKEESLVMLQWLRAHNTLDEGMLFDVALERCRKDPLWSWWHHWLGRYLSSASRWKKQGRPVIELYLTFGKGFPRELLP